MKWNWKSALISSIAGAIIYFAANISAGWLVAVAAMKVEFVYRALASGWYGAITERFGRQRATGRVTATALIVVLGVAHLIDFTVHYAAGTPSLATSLAGSIGLGLLTTSFNLFAMRRGLFVVGPGRRPLREDLRALPGVLRAYLRSARPQAPSLLSNCPPAEPCADGPAEFSTRGHVDE